MARKGLFQSLAGVYAPSHSAPRGSSNASRKLTWMMLSSVQDTTKPLSFQAISSERMSLSMRQIYCTSFKTDATEQFCNSPASLVSAIDVLLLACAEVT
eukprot:3322796-Amphidinium_carterae.1